MFVSGIDSAVTQITTCGDEFNSVQDALDQYAFTTAFINVNIRKISYEDKPITILISSSPWYHTYHSHFTSRCMVVFPVLEPLSLSHCSPTPIQFSGSFQIL
jgi:hypothetical protein